MTEGIEPDAVVDFEIQSRTQHYFRGIPSGMAVCLDIDLPASIGPASGDFQPSQIVVARPGTYLYKAVPTCTATLHLVTETGAPWQGTAALSGGRAPDGGPMPRILGTGPHDITAPCASLIMVNPIGTDLRAFFRARDEAIELTIPVEQPPCTTVHLVDDAGQAIGSVESRWEEIAPGDLLVCSHRRVQNVMLSAPGYLSVAARVDMEQPDNTVVLPDARPVHVLCLADEDPTDCGNLEVECGDLSQRGLLPGSAQRESECTDAPTGGLVCPCEQGAPVFGRRNGDGWQRCERTSPTEAVCRYGGDTASIIVDVPAPDGLLGWAWVPDRGVSVSPLASMLIEGLQPDSGTVIALTAAGWDSERLTLAPGDEAVFVPNPQPYASLAVDCSKPLSVTWWVAGAAVGTLPVPTNSEVPTPTPPLDMEGLVYCASGDHEVVPNQPDSEVIDVPSDPAPSSR